MATILHLHTARRARELRAFDPQDVRPLIEGTGRLLWIAVGVFVALLILAFLKVVW